MKRYTEVEFSRIKLDKDDILLLTTPEWMMGEEQTQVHECMRGLFPDNKIILMSAGHKLEAITPSRKIVEGEWQDKEGGWNDAI